MSRTTIIFHKRSADLALMAFPFTEAGKLLSHFSCNVEAVSGVLLFRLWIRPSQWAVMKKGILANWSKNSKVVFPLTSAKPSGFPIELQWFGRLLQTRRYSEGKTQNGPVAMWGGGRWKVAAQAWTSKQSMWWFHMDSYDWWLKMYKHGSTCLH